MQFIKYDFLTNELHRRDGDKTIIEKVDLKKVDPEIKVLIICQEMEEGKFVAEICTGKSWRPSIQAFFDILDSDLQSKVYYKNALKAHAEVLKKKLFDLELTEKNKPILKEYKDSFKLILSDISTLEKELKDDLSKVGKEIPFILNSPYSEVSEK